MKLKTIALLSCLMFSTNVYAKPVENSMTSLYGHSVGEPQNKKYNYTKKNVTKHSVGAKPGKWCGWYMRTIFGGGPEYNLARNWAKRGTSAGGPRVGAVVVWPHHVGYITGKSSNGKWIVKSGNDGNAVRERARSVSGAITFRML